jgi:hypothetical protein
MEKTGKNKNGEKTKEEKETEKELKNLEKDIDVINEDGLKMSYDKAELERQFPRLMYELSEKDKSLKIKAIDYEIERCDEEPQSVQVNDYSEDLRNLGAIDFIRRCTENEEAFAILDYLLERKELTLQEYNVLKNRIKEEGGLQKLINEYGGIKTPGYFERKYHRAKNLTNNDLNKSKNLD